MAFLTVFSRLKIRTRIYVGFAVTLLLVVVLGGVGITSLKSTQESFHTFKRESGSAVENSDINTDFANLRRDVYRFGTTSNTQAITAAREAIPHIKDQLAGALRSAGTDTRKAKLETAGRMLEAYAADFDKVVSLRAGRDKAEAELAKAGKDASAAIAIIVMTASMNGNQEVTALAGQVQQSFMMARLFSARFSATNDETLADGFKLNFTGFENARTSLAELLTEEEQQRYAADAGKYASIYDRTFDDFAAKSRSLQQLTLSMDADGAAIQQNLLDIVADLTSGLATLDGEMSAVMEAS
ncbi:MCP four helix bundle domain-containing protein, partial [Xanthobacteraceae bacterium Astr-EGSB]|uniref:MCP four helix bundle domain-containing protein n=1 Tax=Astrobacterium formosum TaxID=3069710 RepID=UPI0027B5A39F|nr:MCP four helix bundle domain-containing protein [Xanthobacteraceae bacterium Astr-EGSB]